MRAARWLKVWALILLVGGVVLAWGWEASWPARAAVIALSVTAGLLLRVLANTAQILYEWRRDSLWMLTRLSRDVGRLRADLAAPRQAAGEPDDASAPARTADDHG